MPQNTWPPWLSSQEVQGAHMYREQLIHATHPTHRLPCLWETTQSAADGPPRESKLIEMEESWGHLLGQQLFKEVGQFGFRSESNSQGSRKKNTGGDGCGVWGHLYRGKRKLGKKKFPSWGDNSACKILATQGRRSNLNVQSL